MASSVNGPDETKTVIGYLSTQDGAICWGVHSVSFKKIVVFVLHTIDSYIDQACLVQMTGHWLLSKELGQYPVILTSHLVSNLNGKNSDLTFVIAQVDSRSNGPGQDLTKVIVLCCILR